MDSPARLLAPGGSPSETADAGPAGSGNPSRERIRCAVGRLRHACAVAALRLWAAGAFVVRLVRDIWALPSVRVAVPALAVLVAFPPAWAIYHVYFDRSRLPDIEPFLRFEPPRIGEVRDARGRVLIELAHEYRRVVSYDEVPVVVRQAVLAAEDKNFFSHSGVDYSALPRVIRKTTVRSLGAWWNGARLRLLLPQGGSKRRKGSMSGRRLRSK